MHVCLAEHDPPQLARHASDLCTADFPRHLVCSADAECSNFSSRRIGPLVFYLPQELTLNHPNIVNPRKNVEIKVGSLCLRCWLAAAVQQLLAAPGNQKSLAIPGKSQLCTGCGETQVGAARFLPALQHEQAGNQHEHSGP